MAVRKDKPHSLATYPVFEPHITLASVQSETPVPLSIIRELIPTTQHAFQVKFKSVDVGDHYFRSVYITINLDETLTNLHHTVHERLKISPRTPKYPHVSLVYISDEDADGGEREKYFEELKARQLVSNKGEEGVGLRASVESKWIEGFKASEIWITRCVGPVETWEVLDKISLGV
jgi:2'-5' RNA ligase